MRIWIVAQYSGVNSGVGRFFSLHKYLLEQGCDSTLITSAFSHGSKKHRQAPGLVFVEELGYKANVSIRRAISHWVLALRLRRKLRAMLQFGVPDLIYAAFPSGVVAAVALCLARRHKVPSILDVQDLWPEGLAVALPQRFPKRLFSILTLPWRMFEDNLFKRATTVITVSHTYSKRVQAVRPGEAIPSMHLGFDLDNELHDVAVPFAQRRCEVVYIGTLSYSYDIKTFIDAACLVKGVLPHCVFSIFGRGPKEPEFRAYAEQKGSPVEFRGYVSKEDLTEHLQGCMVGVNAIVANSATTLPNKVFHYCASGLPVVNSVRGELAQYLSDYGAGLFYTAEDARDLAQAILRILNLTPDEYDSMSLAAIKFASNHGNRESSNRKIYQVICQAIVSFRLGK